MKNVKLIAVLVIVFVVIASLTSCNKNVVYGGARAECIIPDDPGSNIENDYGYTLDDNVEIAEQEYEGFSQICRDNGGKPRIR